MKYFLFCAIFTLSTLTTLGQQVNTGMTDRVDSAEIGKIKIQGYVDVYVGYDFNQPKDANRAYAISSPRHGEVNINLAYIDLKYTNTHVRARFIPGVGTYINSNYASESGSLKSIIEANVGLCLSPKKGIWVDAGVMGAPYTNESAFSKDHFLYTRSFGPEFTPYFLSGVRLTYPFSKKFTGYFYVINGWQQITDVNNPLSLATQIEYYVNDKLLLNWNTYAGNESSKTSPNYLNRYFSDFYLIYNLNGKVSLTSDLYFGSQQYTDTSSNQKKASEWWQANFCARYRFSPKYSLSGRMEYFEDPGEIVVKSVTPEKGFSSYSSSLCFNMNITDHAVFRLEGRTYFSKKHVYIDPHGNMTNTDNLIISNITVWF